VETEVDTPKVLRLTGFTPASLSRYCTHARMGKTNRGVSRSFTMPEVCSLALAAELINSYGRTRAEAAAIAASVGPDAWAQVLQYPDTEECWLISEPVAQNGWQSQLLGTTDLLNVIKGRGKSLRGAIAVNRTSAALISSGRRRR
jgi:hypothetical protein